MAGADGAVGRPSFRDAKRALEFAAASPVRNVLKFVGRISMVQSSPIGAAAASDPTTRADGPAAATHNAAPSLDNDEFSFLYHCDFCGKDVTHLMKISCVVCKGTDGEPIDLCVSCFAAGSEQKGHLRTHDYIVKEGLDWPLFDPEWTANEELLLVDGLKVYGIGGPANHEIQGFMPGRDEFDHEFEHEAETAVKDMVFDETDSPDEICKPCVHDETTQFIHILAVLKTTMLNIYNVNLDRRIERKKFLKDRGLTNDFKKQQNIEKKRSKEERELLSRIRVFAKLQTSADFEDFTDGLLRKYRKKTLRNMNANFRRTTAEIENCTSPRISTNGCDYLGRSFSAQYKAAGLARVMGKTPQLNKLSISRVNSSASLPSTPGVATSTGPPLTALGNGNMFKKALNPLDISMAEGVDLLLPNEQQLCANLRILPRAYLVIKETLLRHYAENGSLTRKQARALIRIDVGKTQQIYDLFVINGWIQFVM
ncbi:Transcriptional adapter ada2 [Entophlyctis luteolus]|nr:Transcriptional adapter ada2 [Entophlyctis luteolus]